VRLYVNLDNNSLIASATDRTPVVQVAFKRGDSSVIDVFFTRGGIVQEIDATGPAATGKFGLKVEDDFAGDFLVSDLTWEKVGTGTSTYYRFEPSFNTVELNSALIDGTVSETVADQAARYALTGKTVGYIVAQSDNTTFWEVIDAEELDNAAGWQEAEQLPSVTLMAEIQWIVDGAISSSATFDAVVSNDVIKGDEGIPVAGTPEYPTPAELDALFASLRGYTAESTSSAENIDLSRTASTTIIDSLRLTVGAGSGTFTTTLSLLTADASAGDVWRIILAMPASVNPTIEVRNATSGGTLLYTLAGTGAAFTQLLQFTFNGTAWESDQ